MPLRPETEAERLSIPSRRTCIGQAVRYVNGAKWIIILSFHSDAVNLTTFGADIYDMLEVLAMLQDITRYPTARSA